MAQETPAVSRRSTALWAVFGVAYLIDTAGDEMAQQIGLFLINAAMAALILALPVACLVLLFRRLR